MKKMFILATGIASIGLLAGCGQTENFVSPKVQAQEVGQIELKEKEYYPTNEEIDEEEKSEGLDTIEDIVSSFNSTMHEGAPQKHIDEGFNDDYYHYLESMALKSALTQIGFEKDLLDKDIENLGELSEIIYDGYVLGEDQGDRWKEAVSYLQQLLNDLDIKVNGIDGDLSGFSYEANGEKVDEIENFLND